MHKILITSMLLSFNFLSIYAIPKYPADISYLVSDFKYNKTDGLKICEVQHGSLSVMKGDLIIHGDNGDIPPKIAEFFSQFPVKKWTTSSIYGPLKRSLSVDEWSFSSFLNCPAFLEIAAKVPTDSYDINCYHGMVYADSTVLKKIDLYRNDYPGIIFINAAILPYWIDKYKMSQLFDSHDQLKKYKADWRVYDKKYDPYLATRIHEDMPSELYVIKPRKEFLSNGVIVVARQDLDEVLEMILKKLPNLKNHPDKKYSYWFKNDDENFIIEKHYESDHLIFDHALESNVVDGRKYHYDTTMRIAMIVTYSNGKMSYHGLGGFCKMPYKALQEEGTLNQQRISCGKAPFYRDIDPELFEEINAEMEKAMLLLYEVMLNEKTE